MEIVGLGGFCFSIVQRRRLHLFSERGQNVLKTILYVHFPSFLLRFLIVMIQILPGNHYLFHSAFQSAVKIRKMHVPTPPQFQYLSWQPSLIPLKVFPHAFSLISSNFGTAYIWHHFLLKLCVLSMNPVFLSRLPPSFVQMH